jgi:predicted transcriptional regulator
MKEEFLNFLNALMEAAPDVASKLMNDNIQSYIDMLSGQKSEKPILTENGIKVLRHLQSMNVPMFKAKEVAESMGVTSRGVSGTLRKLVTDGFCEKVGQDPVVYALTNKGKTFDIDKFEGENNLNESND